MINYKILLYKHKTLKDGTHPIVLQLVYNEKPKKYSIVKSCSLDQWDKDKSSYTSKMPNYRNLNMLLNKERSKVDKILTDLAKSDKPFTFETFDRLYKGTNRPASLYAFIETLIKKMDETGKVGNRNIYSSTLKALKSYKPNAKLQPEDIDYNFLKGFEHFKLKGGCGNGGLSVHMRTLRAIINEAINNNYLDKDLYPFTTAQSKKGKYKISKLKSSYNPRGLSISDMDKIKEFNSDLNIHLRKAHLYFLFSYYAGGMSFADIAYLEWSDIIDNRINYNRKKVGSGFSVLISEPIQEILDYFYSINQNGDNYIFPILNSGTHKTPQQMTDRIKKCLKECNLQLKEIQKILEIQNKLTTYVARHSYAQALKSKGYSDEIISKKLRHEDVKTTKHYLKRLAVGELDYVDKDL